MTISIEDSILRLKAEIIAQDWRLSPKRANQLEDAFRCLLDHFKNRKATHGMLVMASNVLDYIKNRGASPAETIDFLKEAMAHIVNLYEELAEAPPQEDEIFQNLFARFTILKEKIQHKSTGKPRPPRPSPTPITPARQARTPDREDTPQATGNFTLHQLIEEFKTSLAKIGEDGQTLHQLFALWLDSPEVTALLHGEPAIVRHLEPDTPLPLEHITPCPPTKVRILTISGLPIAIQSNIIALTRPVTPNKATAYLQNATVPLKDFARFLLKLSGLFSGSLALVKERTLKELQLPIIIPQGNDFPDSPPLQFSTLAVISNGNWHGALACDDIQPSDRTMHKFAKRQNGDLAGTAYLEDGSQFPLLDPLPMLRREGILLLR